MGLYEDIGFKSLPEAVLLLIGLWRVTPDTLFCAILIGIELNRRKLSENMRTKKKTQLQGVGAEKSVLILKYFCRGSTKTYPLFSFYQKLVNVSHILYNS